MALGFRGITGRGRVELALQIPIAESGDGKVAGQHRGEQRGGVRVDRVEGGDASACCRARSAQPSVPMMGSWPVLVIRPRE